MSHRRFVARCCAPALAVAGIACAPIATAGPGCAPLGEAILLPQDIEETSGIAVSPGHPDVLWTHNDGDSQLFAIGSDGRSIAQYTLRPRPEDLEDMASSACADGGTCLYLADTGDNAERRDAGDARVLRVREPDPAVSGVIDLEAFPIRLPDGPRDIEAIFVLPGERVHLVTKGRSHAITVYRYPPPLRPDTVTLEEVQRLTAGPQSLLDQVTGASASADGSVVAVRTYQALAFYSVEGGTLVPLRGGLVNLRTLREIQGEGVGIGADGRVFLTSEGGPLGGPAGMRTLRCAIGAA
jgi:hypothetical protein